jgi:formate hydrogenlyase subunit 3/multisubunit Na+/H+ antiporter MnhD subunit
VLLALAGLGVSVGYLRGLLALLSYKKEDQSEQAALSLQEPRLLLVIISVLAVICIILGLFPSTLIEPLQQLSAGISIPIG